MQPATDSQEPTPLDVPAGEVIEGEVIKDEVIEEHAVPPVPSRPRSFTSTYQPPKNGAKADVGGAPDFMRAASQSPGGMSIVLLPSARIVERLSGPVTVARSDAGVVVTEKGAADLRGCGLRERARRLRAISGSP